MPDYYVNSSVNKEADKRVSEVITNRTHNELMAFSLVYGALKVQFRDR